MPWMRDVVLKNGDSPKALRGVPRGERGSPRAAPKEGMADERRAGVRSGEVAMR